MRCERALRRDVVVACSELALEGGSIECRGRNVLRFWGGCVDPRRFDALVKRGEKTPNK